MPPLDLPDLWAAAVKPGRLDEVIRNSPVIVHAEHYAVAKVRAAPGTTGHFAVFTDDCETTVVTTEARLAACEVLALEKPFAMLEFRVAVPFEAPGFLATICGCLAEGGINVLVYSTFSRDYVLVRWDDLAAAVERLRTVGFVVQDSRSWAEVRL